MSLIDDINRKQNEDNAQQRLYGAQEHLAEIEAKRIENDAFMNPKYSQFWAKRKTQVLLLRTASAAQIKH